MAMRIIRLRRDAIVPSGIAAMSHRFAKSAINFGQIPEQLFSYRRSCRVSLEVPSRIHDIQRCE
jgi:hypothetical protein